MNRKVFTLILAPLTFSITALGAEINTSTETATLACPSSPNCVSSFEHGNHRIQPLSFPGKDTATIHKILVSWIQQDPNARVTYAGTDIIKAEYKSKVFGFVDDLTLLIQPDGIVDVHSAARTGYYDFGVNRDRIEKLRKEFDKK